MTVAMCTLDYEEHIVIPGSSIVSMYLDDNVIVQANGTRLHGLFHLDVVRILKTLPRESMLVCARRRPLAKAKSDGQLYVGRGSLSEPLRARSLEPLSCLARWSSRPHVVELYKGERGLGFSLLDYQDPMNSEETVIVVRALVPGGVAAQDRRLRPGDRLLSVNERRLERASLQEAVEALQTAPSGLVSIEVARPLPVPAAPPVGHFTVTSFI
ncbi:hypothetical protein LAZ67_2004837 [Cordylochernes scorpioides]|uniref:PDZ domain-containing protein n=1 Tax=Cordylochernes scorpioides TaxID=51811 RepID=A0ABY6K3Z8_9ARAC|nr:hypothetical protein LAZ67_2004837 [Cordylochernes scorpioides]